MENGRKELLNKEEGEVEHGREDNANSIRFEKEPVYFSSIPTIIGDPLPERLKYINTS